MRIRHAAWPAASHVARTLRKASSSSRRAAGSLMIAVRPTLMLTPEPGAVKNHTGPLMNFHGTDGSDSLKAIVGVATPAEQCVTSTHE